MEDERLGESVGTFIPGTCKKSEDMHHKGKRSIDRRSPLLARFSVNRPVTVAMCLAAFLLVGVVAYSAVPLEFFPSDFTPAFLYVDIRYNHGNASPQEAEREIARPLEERLRTVKGIKKVRTNSTPYGVSAPVEFQPNTDMVLAYNQVVDRLDRLKSELPEAARDHVRVYKFDADSWGIMWVGVSLDASVLDPYQYLKLHVQRRLERVNGVGRVDLWGVDEMEVMIELDSEYFTALGADLLPVFQSLRTGDFALSGGHVRDSGRRLPVRSLARYGGPDEIGDILIPTPVGRVRLGDVSDVTYEVPARVWYQRIDGRNAVSIGIYKASGANISDVCERVAAVLHEIENDPLLGKKIAFDVFFNQGKFIRDSIRNLESTALWGAMFAAVALLFFFRTLRMVGLVTLAIPLCVVISVAGLYLLGWSLNVLTMMGLIVGVGMVVDNAIVIVENIHRKRSRGIHAREAAIAGAGEVSLAVTVATLTTVVVFLPLVLMSENEQLTFFLGRIGVPVVIALVGSLFVALVFIPQAFLRFGGSETKPDAAIVQRLRNQYERMLNWTLAHRKDAFVIAIVLLGTISIPIHGVRRGDSEGSILNDFRVNFRFPGNFSIEDASKTLAEAERFLERRREEYGIETLRAWFRRTHGSIHVILKSTDEVWWVAAYGSVRSLLGMADQGHLTRNEAIADFKRSAPLPEGVRMNVRKRRDSAESHVSLDLYGRDVDVLADLLRGVERRVMEIPSVVSWESDLERANGEVQVVIDRYRAQKLGLSPQEVGLSIGVAFQGVVFPDHLSFDNREINVRLYLGPSNQRTIQDLKRLSFTSVNGNRIALLDFAELRVVPGRGIIRREDGKTRLQVQVFTTEGDFKALYEDIDSAMDGFDMPRGYRWEKGERHAKLRQEDRSLHFAVTMAVIWVFLLMGVLFESFLLPFSVILSIPFAFLGALWILFLTKTPLQSSAMVGMVVLIGVVVNNAIVLVDRVNRLRAQGLDRTPAILEAGADRFRPIMMTTFTTIGGLLPLALGSSSVLGHPYAPMGRTIIGGLLFSTFFTLLLVPLAYTFLDDLRVTSKRFTTSAIESSASGEDSSAGPPK